MQKVEKSNSLKWATFVGLYIGYTFSILNRKSFSFVLPELIDKLGLKKNEAGLIMSSQNLAYTISKFIGGILCDKGHVKSIFCVGLFASGLLTTSLSVFHSPGAFVVVLFLQGIFQGGLWPACAKILSQNLKATVFNFYWGLLASSMNLACASGPLLTTYILSVSSWKAPFFFYEFGTWYAVLNTGMNVACCIGPFLFLYIASFYNWPATFLFSGVSAIIGSVIVYFMLSNEDTENINSKEKNSLKGRGTWKDLLVSPLIWLVSASYFTIFMARTALLDWGQLYLIQDLGHSTVLGSMFVSGLEIGGVVGTVTAGMLADHMVSQQKESSINGAPRMKVALCFVALLTTSLHYFLFFLSPESSMYETSLVGFLIGVGVYGPISIYGVVSMEASPQHLQGTSHAIVSLVANVGAVIAGFPFSLVARSLEWKGAFVALECTLVTVMFIKIMARNIEYKTVSTKKKMQ